ncbi:LysR family transcriptional regulator [Streptomyces sp. ODS05-4]|uniref:LysR family transcriptional regulator n=1 Tax=Streptomyces sp. ODS05-4 TaxID=2944939 RepID=UPI00210B8094|nr:LysR family transcriptional regulator [Streptomyces sp. ODS05-4]
MFDSRYIRTFQEVVRTGSYTAAARALGFTQPAVSQQMKALERDVGTALFTRVGRGLKLTEAGEALTRHTAPILDSLEVARQQIDAIARLRSGRVRICAFPSAAATILPRAMARVREEHPGVMVELSEGEPPDSLRALARGECDIALAFDYPGFPVDAPEELAGVRLMEDPLTVLLPVGHPMARRRSVRLADLANERWIAGCARCRTYFVHACAEGGFTPDIVCTTDDNLVLQSLVAAGVGIAMVPSLVLSFLCHDKVTGRIVEPHTRRQVYAYALRDHLRIPATALLLEEITVAAAARVGC